MCWIGLLDVVLEVKAFLALQIPNDVKSSSSAAIIFTIVEVVGSKTSNDFLLDSIRMDVPQMSKGNREKFKRVSFNR